MRLALHRATAIATAWRCGAGGEVWGGLAADTGGAEALHQGLRATRRARQRFGLKLNLAVIKAIEVVGEFVIFIANQGVGNHDCLQV